MSGSRVSLQHSWRKWPKYFLAEGVRVGSPPSEWCVSNIQTETSDKEREEDGGGWKSTAVSGWQNLNLILHTVFEVKLVHFIHYWIHNELFSVVDLFFYFNIGSSMLIGHLCTQPITLTAVQICSQSRHLLIYPSILSVQGHWRAVLCHVQRASPKSSKLHTIRPFNSSLILYSATFYMGWKILPLLQRITESYLSWP